MCEQAIDVENDAASRTVKIHWSSTQTSRFHYVWLRHSARCSDGMPNDTSVKIDLLPDEPSSLVVESAQLVPGYLCLRWADDGMVTQHRLETLRRWAYDEAARARRKHHPILWDAQSAAAIPVFDTMDFDEPSLHLALLLAVRDYGLVKIRGLPAEPGVVRHLASYFGPIHVNNYGSVFDVRADAMRSLGSNTGVELPPHTDESYRHGTPGISFFHCIEPALDGGHSILVDGFRAAAALKASDAKSFAVLSSVPVFFQRYAPPDEDMRSHARILVKDVDGEIVGIRWTDRTLPPQDLPFDLVEPTYRAIRALWKIINNSEFQHHYRMQAGDLHIFDNQRVLHGRGAFNAQPGSRYLQQCSVNRDEFHSRLRTLAGSQDSAASELVMAGGALG